MCLVEFSPGFIAMIVKVASVTRTGLITVCRNSVVYQGSIIPNIDILKASAKPH